MTDFGGRNFLARQRTGVTVHLPNRMCPTDVHACGMGKPAALIRYTVRWATRMIERIA